MKILIADDDRPVSLFISRGLTAESYAVDQSYDGAEALQMALTVDYDLVILDMSMPGMDGSEVVRRLRAIKPDMRILVLSGRSQTADRVATLDGGADDYLTKPFSMLELSARVRTLLRRRGTAVTATLKVADMELDRVARTVSRGGRRIELTVKEFGLLELLMLNAGRTLTRAAIIDQVWNLAFDSGTNVVDVYINYLRHKVDYGFEQRLIRTVRGMGYQLCVPNEPAQTTAA